MNSILPALEAFVTDESAWLGWTALLLRADLPVTGALRRAVRKQDEEGLNRAANLLATSAFRDRLFNAFATHPELNGCGTPGSPGQGGGFDSERFQYLLEAAVGAARLAIRIQTAGLAELTMTSWNDCLARVNTLGNLTSTIALAKLSLQRAGCGPVALTRWVADYLGFASDRADTVPVACVTEEGCGVIARLIFKSSATPAEMAPAVLPDVAAALTPTREDLLSAFAAVIPSRLNRTILWRVIVPTGARVSSLGGSSLQGAAAIALTLINRAERCHSGILVLAESSRGALRPVGFEDIKLEAAVESFDRGRASGDANGDQTWVQKVIISSESACDMTRADGRGMPWLRLATVEEAVEKIIAANQVGQAECYQIARATRTIKAVRPLINEVFTVPTANGDVSFDPESRTDYISEVTFSDSNRFCQPYTLHYRAHAASSLIDASSQPAEDNLFLDHWNYADYERHRRSYEFRFNPSPGASYTLHTRVFDGFGPGNRNMHCHFFEKESYDLIIFLLDLSAYAAPARDSR